MKQPNKQNIAAYKITYQSSLANSKKKVTMYCDAAKECDLVVKELHSHQSTRNCKSRKKKQLVSTYLRRGQPSMAILILEL